MEHFHKAQANPETDPSKRLSECNLNHYIQFRQLDARDLQKQLGETGLSRFARAEGHIMHSFRLVHMILQELLQKKPEQFSGTFPTSTDAHHLMTTNTESLFGNQSPERRVRVMVTIPSEGATNPTLIDKLVQEGMNCARINCAHDDESAWLKMIECVRASEIRWNRSVKVAMDLAGPKIRTGEIISLNSAGKPYLRLKTGEMISLLKSSSGEKAVYSTDGQLISHASISCTYPALIDQVAIGDKIFFDDGKIEGVVEERITNGMNILITRSKPEGSKLRPDKGINAPDSQLAISGLTDKDKQDFAFVARHADIVNFTFVNSPEDLHQLFQLIDQYRAHNLGVILKIETKRAFNNLYSLLRTTMTRSNPIGVMIARGDLAVEAGWENIGYVQSEIIRICTAGHIPIVWATQVLENYAKEGIPSRSELTDISQAMKAECVMLNKGPYIVEALAFLNRLLIQGESFQNKNLSMLPSMRELV
jgi:pyruvate kinase